MSLKLLNHIFLLFIVLLMTACSVNKHVCSLVPVTPQDGNLPTFRLNEELNWTGTKFTAAIFVSGSYAYLGVGNTLIVLDVSDPSNPLWLENVILPNTADSIIVAGNYAFVSNDSQPGESSVIDISNPHRLVEVGCQGKLMPSFFNASKSQEYIFVPSQEDGEVRVYAVNNDTKLTEIVEVGAYQSRTPIQFRFSPMPEIVGSEPRILTDVILTEGYAFVAENSWGGEALYRGQIQVLDVSNPQTLKPVATYIMPQQGSAIRLFSSEDYIFVVSGVGSGYSALILDISEPMAPSLVTVIEALEIPIGINENYAYSVVYFEEGVATIRVRELTNSAQIVIKDWHTSEYGWILNWRGNAAFVENYLYLIGSGSLFIIDIEDPLNPNLVDVIAIP
ncbi:MAG: hypothetical protein KJ069_21275 [Anaerolineae bacterium]|nr:hypothetical protein [Anaerolineae bacterium]